MSSRGVSTVLGRACANLPPRPFAQEERLKTESARPAEPDALLNLEQKDVEIADEEPDEESDSCGNLRGEAPRAFYFQG